MSKSSPSTKVLTVAHPQLSSTYYRDTFHLETNLAPATETFFSQINHLETYNISDFLSTLEKKNRIKEQPYFSEENLQKLFGKINQLSSNDTAEFATPDLDKILNSLAGLGFKKEMLSGLNIQNLVAITNDKIDKFKPREIANIVNAFARLGYDKDDLKIDSAKLSGRINQKISGFTHQDTLISLHAFAQLGYGEEDLGHSVKNLISSAKRPSSKKLISNFDGREISTLIHSLAKMEMFDELFNPDLRSQINATFTTKTITDLSPESAFSLLQAQMICDLILGDRFFADTTSSAISKNCKNETAKISQLQQKVANHLPKNQLEYPLYKISETSLRDVDIFYKTDRKNYFIEVDGPTHFYSSKNSAGEISCQKNSATVQRDRLNEAAILRLAERNRDEDFYYLTLPFFEIANLTYKQLSDVLKDKFTNSSKLEPTVIEQEAVEEEKVAEDSLAAPENEPVKIIKPAAAKKTKSKKPAKTVKETATPQAIPNDPKTEKLIEFFFTTKNLAGFAERFAHSPNVDKIFEKAQAEINGSSRSDITSALIRAGAPLPQDAATMMNNAIVKNHSDIIEALITTGIDVNATLPNGKNPLDFAAHHIPPNVRIVNSLIAAGANIETAEIDAAKANSLLQQSLAEGCIESSCALLKLGTTVPKGILKKALELESPALVIAITEKAGFNPQNEEAKSALRAAVKSNNVEIFDTLVAARINVAEIDFTGAKKFLFDVIHDGNPNSILRLAQNKEFAKLTFPNGSTPLHVAAFNGDVDVAAALVESDAPLNAATSIGSTPLHLAAFKGNKDIVQILVDAGADTQATSIVKNSLLTPLHSAIIANRDEIAEILITKTEISSDARIGLVKSTITNNHPKTFETLIKHWPLSEKDKLNGLLLFLTKEGPIEFIKILTDNGVDPNIILPDRNDPPLHTVICEAHLTSDKDRSLKIINSLIDAGADVNLSSKNGFAPLAIAAHNGHKDIVQILIERGATSTASPEKLPKRATLLIQDVISEMMHSLNPSSTPSETTIKSLKQDKSQSSVK